MLRREGVGKERERFRRVGVRGWKGIRLRVREDRYEKCSTIGMKVKEDEVRYRERRAGRIGGDAGRG
eukprot:3940584-Rhodomonas_salina.1